MSQILDDKAPHVIPFITEQLLRFEKTHKDKPRLPFFVGINGCQGAGKSTLVDIIKAQLNRLHHRTVVFSLDDFYLTYQDQKELARTHPDNPLLQHRGQPGTHDLPLLLETITSLRDGRPTKIPRYNKAAMSGQGDRFPEEEWDVVNSDPSDLIQVVLFEGWCTGFRPLNPTQLEAKHRAAVQEMHGDGDSSSSQYKGRLGYNTLETVQAINSALEDYDNFTNMFDAFIYLVAADPQYVYAWRLQAEQRLRETKGSGMTDEQVKKFVDGYYPAYELYTEELLNGAFRQSKVGTGDTVDNVRGRQLNIVIGQDRKIQTVTII